MLVNYKLITEFKLTEADKFCKKYSIQINKDGSVFDNKRKTAYNSILDWIKLKNIYG
jgi:hypothetical protein